MNFLSTTLASRWTHPNPPITYNFDAGQKSTMKAVVIINFKYLCTYIDNLFTISLWKPGID